MDQNYYFNLLVDVGWFCNTIELKEQDRKKLGCMFVLKIVDADIHVYGSAV